MTLTSNTIKATCSSCCLSLLWLHIQVAKMASHFNLFVKVKINQQ